MPADRFAGFPSQAEQWFASMLGESDWSRVAARASEHETVVRGPMIALCEALAAEFGPAHVWHLHRDPWLWSHQVATVPVVDNIGLRVELSLDALRVSGDWPNGSADQVERYRASVATTTGEWLADTVARLRRTGFTIGGHRLARPPRGTPLNHPRGHLLRHRTLTVSREWPAGAWRASPLALRRTRPHDADVAKLRRRGRGPATRQGPVALSAGHGGDDRSRGLREQGQHRHTDPQQWPGTGQHHRR